MNLNNGFEDAAITAMIGVFEYPITTALTTTTGLAETPIGIIGPGPINIAIGNVSIHPAAALTADPTNNVTVTINKRTAAAPGTAVPIAIGVSTASGTNSTGSWVQWKAVPLTVQTGAGSFVSPGDAITVVITKGGAGVTFPVSQIVGYTTIN